MIRLAGGSFYGDNTDFYGFAYLLEKAGADPFGKKAVVLGGGGSSRTVQAVLKDKGAGEIIVVERVGINNYGNIDKHRDADIIINATPVGMYPNNGKSPLADLSIFTNLKAVIDLIYNPARTELLMTAEDMGVAAAGGLAMLAAQAKKSAELFTGEPIPDEKIETIISKLSASTLNIILIGMPGCGKTSVGRSLAEMTGKEFADTDEMIAKTAGKSVPSIINEDGEDVFRAMETETLREICKQGGKIIATGGGIVKRPENRHLIHQNGFVIFLERDISELPVEGRPLSEREGLKALAAARLPLYRKWSDYTAPVYGVERTAEDIYKNVSINYDK
jgi:shikimate dehydrogenase